MIVIADASPIRYAHVIGIAPALVDLYGHVVLPGKVFEELTHANSPVGKPEWLAAETRVEIRPVFAAADPALNHLDPGEREAIFLAETIRDSLLLVDDLDARREALRRKLAVTGLLGAMRDCALRGLLDFESTLAGLKATDFRISPRVEDEVRRQFHLASKL